MKKKVIIFALCFLLLIGVVSAFSFSDFFSKISGRVIDASIKPVCSNIGSRSEGWSNSDGFIKYASCAECKSVCKTVKDKEGWYSSCDDSLILEQDCDCDDTCASFDYECGVQSICGQNVSCGSCGFGQVCNNGFCEECIPRTCESLDYECGTINDGCGRVLICGSCDEDSNCVEGHCRDSRTCISGEIIKKDEVFQLKVPLGQTYNIKYEEADKITEPNPKAKFIVYPYEDGSGSYIYERSIIYPPTSINLFLEGYLFKLTNVTTMSNNDFDLTLRCGYDSDCCEGFKCVGGICKSGLITSASCFSGEIIQKGDSFRLEENGASTFVQYVGADKITEPNPKAVFKMDYGEEDEYTNEVGINEDGSFSLMVFGRNFDFINVSYGIFDDYDITFQCGYDSDCCEGFECANGICKETEPDELCVDSDGGLNYYVKGSVVGVSSSGDNLEINDGCIIGGFHDNWLREAICSEEIPTWQDYECPNGCGEGKCIASSEEISLMKPFCSGIGTINEGWINSYRLIKYDSCEDCETICIGDKEDVDWDEESEEGWYSSCDGSLIQLSNCLDLGTEDSKEKRIECEEGCYDEERCYPLGYRQSGRFCSENNYFSNQFEEGKNCNNNFECESNLCLNGECISGTLVQRILNWFRNNFGQ